MMKTGESGSIALSLVSSLGSRGAAFLQMNVYLFYVDIEMPESMNNLYDGE